VLLAGDGGDLDLHVVGVVLVEVHDDGDRDEPLEELQKSLGLVGEGGLGLVVEMPVAGGNGDLHR
jgi:hypothetical protein